MAREQGRGEARAELATLQERASQIPKLTADLSQALANNIDILSKVSDLQVQVAGITQDRQALAKDVIQLKDKIRETESDRDNLRNERDQLSIAKAELETTVKKERLQTEEKLAILNDAKEAFTIQFKVLASEILDEKTKKFTDENAKNMSIILNPLAEKLTEFKTKVEETYDKESKLRFSLQDEVKRLIAATAQIGSDATNLTKALKGESKTQGIWGEMILERVLERSGLTKGREYAVQESHQQEDGSRVQPDVIIYLPESKHVVIDSKVSLTAYERYCSEEDEAVRRIHLQEHIKSQRTHVQNLSAKNYQTLYQLNSLDFVVMFVPIEAAFLTAVQHDPELFTEAFNKNIMIVCPSTLLPTLRTIASIWRQENQNRNAQEIARLAAALYDKLVGFVNTFEVVGKRLDDAKNAYQETHKQLATGKGNLIRQAEKFKELGVQPTKSLSQSLIEATKTDEEKFLTQQAEASPSSAESNS
jgi:DNA recombination protein RmuC